MGRKGKRTLQHSPQNQTDHLQIPLASEATIGRTDRPQRDFGVLTTDIPSTISTEFNGMVASATEDGHGVDWAAPALYQDSFNTQATFYRMIWCLVSWQLALHGPILPLSIITPTPMGKSCSLTRLSSMHQGLGETGYPVIKFLLLETSQ